MQSAPPRRVGAECMGYGSTVTNRSDFVGSRRFFRLGGGIQQRGPAMTITDVGGLLIGAYVSGWVAGFLTLKIKRFFEVI